MREFSFLSTWAITEDAQRLGVLNVALTREQLDAIANLARRALASSRRDGDFSRVAHLPRGTLLDLDDKHTATSPLRCRSTREGFLRLTGTSLGRPFHAELGYCENLVLGWSDGRTGCLADYLNGRLTFPLTKE